MISAIIVAGGAGSRMGPSTLPKQFLCVGGKPSLAHTLQAFDAAEMIEQIVLVTRPQDRDRCETLIAEHGLTKIMAIVAGGKERQDSVFAGLQHLNPQTEIVLIHDAVRMFVTEAILVESIHQARQHGASITAVPAKDTIKQVQLRSSAPVEAPPNPPTTTENTLFVASTLDRKTLWQVQTPQTFRYPFILSIYQKALETGFYGTDDAMLAEHFGHPVKIVNGSYRNIKITTPDDLLIAETFLQHEIVSDVSHDCRLT